MTNANYKTNQPLTFRGWRNRNRGHPLPQRRPRESLDAAGDPIEALVQRGAQRGLRWRRTSVSARAAARTARLPVPCFQRYGTRGSPAARALEMVLATVCAGTPWAYAIAAIVWPADQASRMASQLAGSRLAFRGMGSLLRFRSRRASSASGERPPRPASPPPGRA